jgi:MFS family permease
MTPSSSAWRTLALTSVAVFVVSLDGTVLFVAFPAIRATFAQVSAAQLSWVLNAYTIVFGALLVPAGRIADRVGRKRIFLLGLGLFSAASALCGVAPSPGMLIAARALQLQVLDFQKENEYGEVSLVDLGWRGKSASEPRDR